MTVEVGQVWSDNHPFEGGKRHVRIDAIVRGSVIRGRRADYALVTVIASNNRRAIGRRTRIRIDRCRPGRNGYTLLPAVDGKEKP